MISFLRVVVLVNSAPSSSGSDSATLPSGISGSDCLFGLTCPCRGSGPKRRGGAGSSVAAGLTAAPPLLVDFFLFFCVRFL